jgi:MFS family permease
MILQSLVGPSRAVAILAITQVLSWGILIYPPVLTMPHITAARGWSLASGMAGFSLALIVSGLMSPTIGSLIDRRGGSTVMAAGALVGALGLAGLTVADHPALYFACWLLLGIAMSATLYDASFASLTTIFGSTARRQITFVTFSGGFASTVGWPATHLLLENFGWRGTYLVFAAVLVLIVAPLHFALPRGRHHAPGSNAAEPAAPAHLPQGRLFLLLAAAFAIHAFILSGLTSNLLAMLKRGGIDAAQAVALGALFGPAQVAARLVDFMFAKHTQPLWIARGAVLVMALGFAMLAFVGISVPIAMMFLLGIGAANGVMTIARGALPLQLFGPEGYGRVLGRIARPALIVQALAPFAVSLAIERFSDERVLQAGVIGALVGVGCLLAVNPARPALHRK